MVHIRKECTICGNEYFVRPYRDNMTKCCSKECLSKYNSKRLKGKIISVKPTKICEMCGVEYYAKRRNRFCSQKCTSKWRSTTNKTNPPRNKGMIYSKEIKEKMSNAQKGKKYTEETRRKHSERQKGEKNHQRKGGISTESNKVRNSQEYKARRLDVYERDNFTCQMPGCGKRGGFEVHHIKKFNKYPQLRFDVNNGITLCKKCHEKTFYNEHQYEDLFTKIVELN